ncbi:MAG TPA: hypothetical protein VFI21_07045 [Nocardioides sp.]|nr:hypothetical protein [Nocardioides sp.]
MSLHLSAPRHIPWADLAGVRVGVVLWGGLAILDVARIAAAPSYVELGAVGLLVTAASIGMRPATGLVSAVVGWSLVDGFVEHRYGILGFDFWRDLGVLALLISLALVATRATLATRAPR